VTDEHSAWPTAFPRIPERPPRPDNARPGRGRLILVALLAALAGGLASGALVLGVLERRGVFEPQSPPAVTQVTLPAAQTSTPPQDRVVAVAEAVRPAVVQVDVSGGQGRGNGSGVVYRSDGYIITNHHVVSGAERLSVKFADGSEEDAVVVGVDPETDLAVLRVERTDLVAIAVGDADDLEVGELAVAVGSPFGLDGSVTAGIVSAINRGVSVSAPGGGTVALADVVQTDAPINPGNSGGPLVDGEARLIGINSAILTSGSDLPNPGNAGVGFAIPAGMAVDVAEELIANGSVQYAFLGVAGLTLTPEMTDRLGVPEGVYVQSVTPGSPADAVGLREGDVILAINDQPLDGVAALVGAIRQADVGETITVTYRRGTTDATVEVTLSEAPQ
jgi:S1-C subfamily serine protease